MEPGHSHEDASTIWSRVSATDAVQPATAILVVQVAGRVLDPSHHWQAAPLPVPLPMDEEPDHIYRRFADQRAREDFFSSRVHGLLYGPAAAPVRWHRWVSQPLTDDWDVLAVEYLRYPSFGPPNGLLAIHAVQRTGQQGLVAAVATLANLRPNDEATKHRHQPRDAVEALIAELLPGGALRNRRVGYLITHVAFPEGPPTGPLPDSLVNPVTQWTRVLAWVNQPEALPGRLLRPGPQVGEVLLSASWDSCVQKPGAAFVGRTGTQTDGFHVLSKALVHSTYLDALMLGLLERDCIDELSDAAEKTWDAGHGTGTRKLMERMMQFRTRAWWSDISETENVNLLLTGFQAVHDLPARQDRLHSEIVDAASYQQSRRTEQTNLLLNLVIVMSFAFGLASLIADPGRWGVAWGAILAIAAGGILLAWQHRDPDR